MAKLVFLIVLLAATVAGVGFYRGWFHLSSDTTSGDPNYTVTVDKQKLKDDQAQAEHKLKDIEHKVQEKVAPTTRRN